jgi:hypothetical protein
MEGVGNSTQYGVTKMAVRRVLVLYSGGILAFAPSCSLLTRDGVSVATICDGFRLQRPTVRAHV